MMRNKIRNKIEGDFVNLVPLSVSCLDDMWEYSSNPLLYEHFEFNQQMKKNETKVYLEKLIERSNGYKAHWWFIKINDESKVVGTIGVHEIEESRKSCEISYAVSPDYWGKGVFVSALDLMLKYLTNEMKMHRITATTSEKNIRSINALKKFGFCEEGMMRDYYCGENGYFNAILLSLIVNNSTLDSKI